MGFWVGLISVGPPQGDSWVFGYLWGFLYGFKGRFMHINAILMIEHVFCYHDCDITNYYCSDLFQLFKLFEHYSLQ